MDNISIIGFGVMGAEIAKTLLKNGHRVIVCNRTPAKAEPLVAAGATLAPASRDATVRGTPQRRNRTAR